jgi:vitamin B12 transporter
MSLAPLRYLLLALLLLAAVSPVWAVGDEELSALGFDTGAAEPQVTTSHIIRPTSKIAENVTVVTAEEIARINAHTLADVLQTVPGISMDVVRTPGSSAFFNIQGALNTQVLVLMDGVPLNNLNQNVVFPGDIPVQQIERVEIVKGAASAAWGPALGGVVNIVTKSPEPGRPVSGALSASYGERATSDSRFELTGTTGPVGYYLSAGHLHSDGLLANNGVNNNNLYAKLTYALPSRGLLTLGYAHTDVKKGQEEIYVPSWDMTLHDNASTERGYGFASLAQPLGERLQLDLLGYFIRRPENTIWGHLDQGAVVKDADFRVKEAGRGLKASLTWGDSDNNLVTGLEYEHGETTEREALSGAPPYYDYEWERVSTYANGTVSLGRLTILPGIRFDHTGINGDYLSYTLGATYRLSDSTVLRAYGAKGYSLPNPRFLHDLQETRTVQAGFETGAVPYLWLKGTFFYNWLDGVESYSTLYDQLKQGFELEARTLSFHGLSLSAGYTYLYATDRDTDKQLESDSGQSVPPQTVKLGLNYNNRDLGLKGTLLGNYVWWHAPSYLNAKYDTMTWDLHLNWKLCPTSERSPELFFSGHNLFNGTQYNNSWFKNTPRWLELGLRFKF